MATHVQAHLAKHARTPLIHNPSFQRNGLKHYVRALRKYNIGPTVPGPYHMMVNVEQHGSQALLKSTGRKVGGRAHVAVHTLLKRDSSTGEDGRVPAQDVENNSMYLCPVNIGTPAQTLSLDFDTGSADLWCFSTELKSHTTNHNVFDPTKSSSWKNTSGSTWNISYGDGSGASGNVGTDNVSIGGLVIRSQAVELAQKLSSEFETGAGDGLLGLAWGPINTVEPKRVQTPVENMITQGDIEKGSQLFTCWLDNTAGNSWYTFGYIDKTALSGIEPSYTPIDNSQGFWQFPSSSAAVDGEAIDREGNTAIADTGTTLCLVDDKTCEKIYGAITGAKLDQDQQGWVIPSDTALTAIPKIEFAVGDELFTVNPADVMFQDLGNGFTYGGIQSNGDQGFDILGDVFLRSVYCIFDQGNTRFGCVQRTPAATSGESTRMASKM